MCDSLRCRLGLHDWTFLYYGDRYDREIGFGVHECRRCEKRPERFRWAPWLL